MIHVSCMDREWGGRGSDSSPETCILCLTVLARYLHFALLIRSQREETMCTKLKISFTRCPCIGTGIQRCDNLPWVDKDLRKCSEYEIKTEKRKGFCEGAGGNGVCPSVYVIWGQ